MITLTKKSPFIKLKSLDTACAKEVSKNSLADSTENEKSYVI